MGYLRMTLDMKGATDTDKIELIREMVDGYKPGSADETGEGKQDE